MTGLIGLILLLGFIIGGNMLMGWLKSEGRAAREAREAQQQAQTLPPSEEIINN
jgi:hypothetical protein